MTEISLLRLFSVPAALVEEIRRHVMNPGGCPKCWIGSAPIRFDTRHCEQAEAMVERCVKFELAKRNPEGTENER